MRIKYLPKFKLDKNLLFILIPLILLSLISILLQVSAGNGNFYKFAFPQLIKIIIGVVIFIIIYFLKSTFIFSIVEVIYIFCLLLVILVELVGTVRLGAQRWLHLGLLIIQPSEFMKIAVILMTSKLLHKIPLGQEGKIKNYLLPFILSLVPSLLIILQPDLGTASTIIITTVVLFFIAGLQIRYFIIVAILGLVTAPMMWFNLYSYQRERILIFLNPEKDPLGSGYHIIQSKIAIGSGGILGKGFLQGSQSQLNFIPEKHTDFIFSLLTEEFGFLGALTLIVIYLIIILFCLVLVLKSSSNFVKFTTFGLTFILFIQVFLNIGMVTGILPIVGIPLPIISYGGTSIITTLSTVAIILNLNKLNNHNLFNNYN